MALTITAQQLLIDSALMAGIGDLYNTPDAATQQLGLRVINDLLDSWSGEPLVLFQIVEGQVTLPTNGTNTVSLPSGTVLERPAQINEVAVVDASGFRHPVRIIGDAEWSSLVWPGNTSRPIVVYFDYAVPTMTAYFYPTPSFAGDVAHFWYPQQLTQFTALTQALVAPQGYSLALKTAAAELLLLAMGRDIPAQLAMRATEAKRVLKIGHNQPQRLPIPPALRGAGGVYNIYTDEPNL